MNLDQRLLISQYLDEILKINEKINLTRIIEKEEAELLHIEDSLSVLDELNKAPDGLYGDLGSGGGFPGVPLAIASRRQTILIDSVQKKMKAVEEILSLLNLNSQITTSGERIEDLGITKREAFSVLTARALSKLGVLLELASPLLKNNGHLICLKAHIEKEEIDHAISLEAKTGMKLIHTRELTLTDGKTHREIFVFQKIKEPSIKLPRRVGMAQKKPL